MERTIKVAGAPPRWVQWLLNLNWYEWLAWIVEIGMLVMFVWITYDQFAEGLPRAGWIMIALSILFVGPGLWLILGYRPSGVGTFGKREIGVILCFVIWAGIFLYLLGWGVDFQPGFGNRL